MNTRCKRPFVIATTVVIFYILGTSFSSSFLYVYGHASPVTFNPKPNQALNSTTSLPNKVTITFTERPELKASSIKVTDSKNNRVDNNDLKSGTSDKEVTISLDKAKILPGIYTVNWIVLSKDDGHITKGSYVFTINSSENKNSTSSSDISQKNQSQQL